MVFNKLMEVFYSAYSSNSKNENNLYEVLSEIKNTAYIFLQFAFCEYDIYSSFNQIIIALASCLLSSKEKEEDKNKIIYQNIIKLLKNLNIDLGLIEECMNNIIINFNSDEEDNSDENTVDEESPKSNTQKENNISLKEINENNNCK